MGLGAAIGAVATIGSAVIGGSAAKSAANTQSEAAKYAADMQWKQYEQTRGDLAPWREAGSGALSDLTSRLPALTTAPNVGPLPAIPTGPNAANFRTDPGYEWALSEGLRAVEGSAASRGMLMSGGTLKDLTRFGSGFADQQYSDWWNRENTLQTDFYNRSLGQNETAFARDMAVKDSIYNKLSGVATMGQNAATQTGQMGQNAAANAGNYLTQGANAAAAGTIGQANAWSGGLSNLASLAMNSNLFGGGGSTYARLTPAASSAMAQNPSIF